MNLNPVSISLAVIHAVPAALSHFHLPPFMDALLTSTLLVAIAEIGDKTQLLSFVLAARLKKPLAIGTGILVATLANHLLAGSLGVWLASLVATQWLPWISGTLFILFGVWALKPDQLDEVPPMTSHGAFMTALIAFFLAEMGDKTQFATITLAARFDALALVVIGTTLGMLITNIPAVMLGERLAQRLPLALIRYLAAGVFVLTGLWSLPIWQH